MSGSRDKVQSLVNYYLREGFTHSVELVCDEILKRSPNDAFLQFWKAYVMFITGSVSEVRRSATMFALRTAIE